jgi:hypothetical protein
MCVGIPHASPFGGIYRSCFSCSPVRILRIDLTSLPQLYLILQLPLSVHPAVDVLADGKKLHQTQADEVEFLT